MGDSDSFVHLHVHTDYSKLDGMETVEEVAQFAAADGQPAAAISDHGNMSGYIKFEKACHDAGIKPIPGLEAYHVDSYERVRRESDRSRDHMLLLGVSDDGYRNLLEISSRAYLDQFYVKPLVDDALIAGHTKGVVLTSGCLGSPINQAILAGEEKKARDLLGMYRDLMDPGHFFAEVQVHDFPEQQKVNKVFIPMALDMGLPLLASQDAHYAAPKRAIAHERMLAMQTGSTLSDPKRFKFASHSNYLATAAEMRRMVPADMYPGACDNTLLVAEMASGISKQAGSKYLIPSFDDAKDFGGEQAMLRHLVLEGCRARYGTLTEALMERIDYELGVIHDMGFDAYFLIVWDFVKWAKDAGIYVGPGRGSAAGAVVSYALDITTIDPIAYDLYFERFLNPGRKSMPDIDIDFEPDGRAKVREYLKSKYGYDHVAYIATQGKFHGRSAIKGAARIYEVPPTVANQVSSTFPQNTKLSILDMITSLEDLKRGDPDRDAETKAAWDEGRDFRAAVRKGGDLMLDVVEAAADVEGYIQNFGVHAAAVLITPKPLTNFVPLTTETTDTQLAVCGYDKDDAEAIGGLKMDLLGLINLTTIRKCVEQVRENYSIDLDVNTLPLDDKKTFALLQRADTEGVFQLAGDGMKDLLRRVVPTRFEDLSAVLALYRPGPMGTEMHYEYADRKNGRSRVRVEHPDMLKFAGNTFGLIVYQEQMLALATQMAGFSAGEADTLRKATGKKNLELLAAQEPKFKDGMVANGYTRDLANTLWDKLPSFASYSFNAAHSMAYAMVSYQTAYLKANFPAEYAAACVDTLADPNAQMRWAKALGVTFEVPDVNESHLGARAFEGKVRLGLAGIKGLGSASCEAILDERRDGGLFLSLSDFLVRAIATKKVNKTALEALVQAGALDSLASSRGTLLDRLPNLIEQARSAAPKDDVEGWGDDGGLLGEVEAPTIVLDFDPRADETMLLSERLGRQVARLGVFLGTHPMTLFTKHLGERIPRESREVSPRLALGEAMVHGIVTAIQEKKTRRSVMHTVTLEARDGYSLDVKVFGDAADVRAAGLGALMLVSGVLQEDEWQKSSVSDVDDDGVDAGESPRELLVDDKVVIPLAALDDADGATDPHNISIVIEDSSAVARVARALAGRFSPGLRMVTVITPDGVSPLPEMVGETAEQVAALLADIEEVTVERA